jgi:tRNA dimethylallyltransferase
MEKQKIIVICGPTASGKSNAAMRIATEFKAEIVNADSMQIYRHMDIGTAKPTKADRLKVAHYLIDHVEPDEPFSAAKYREDASEIIEQIGHQGKNVIVCGGSGLYIRVLTKGIFKGPERDSEYRETLESEAFQKGTNILHDRLKAVDPVSAKNIHPNNLVRIIRALEVFHASGRPFSEFHAEHAFTESPYDALMLYMDRPRAKLYERINARTDQMIESGLVDEVKTLISLGYNEDLKPMRALGYKEIIEYIHGRLSLSEATELLKKNTRNYAKRQITWFRSVEELNRVSPSDIDKMNELIRGHLA